MRSARRVAVGMVMVLAASASSSATALMNPRSVATAEASSMPYGLYPGLIDLGGIANDLVFSSDGQSAFATTREGVHVLRTSDWTETELIETADRAFALRLIDDETRLAVAVTDDDTVLEFDLASNHVVATHDLETPWGLETVNGDLLVTSATPFPFVSPAMVDRSADPATVTERPDLAGLSGAIEKADALGSVYMTGIQFPSLDLRVHRLDFADPDVPIVASSPTVERPADVPLDLTADPARGRLLVSSGQVLDALDLTPGGTITAGIAVLGDDNTIYALSYDQIAVHNADTLELERSWEPACAEYREGIKLHDAWLSPDAQFLVIPLSAGLCLEPVDGSGPGPALLHVEIDTTNGNALHEGVLVVIDAFGNIVVEEEAGDLFPPAWARGYSTWLVEGEYVVTLLRASDTAHWPYVPTTQTGHALLERDAAATRVEGETAVHITLPPFHYDIVTTSPTFWSSIQWLVLTGITHGCGPESFCPNDFVTRGQMAAFLDRALDLPTGGPTGFTDDAGTFQQNIRNLRAAGITTGCAPDRFCTNDYVTRGEMAAFLDRALDLPTGGPTGFTDDAGTFQQNIRNLRAAGITTGCAPDRFCTNDYVTRAQMAAFLERALADDWPDV